MYGLNGTAVNILCKAHIAVDYCWFTHPLGQRISVTDRLTATATATTTGDDPSSSDASYFGAGLRMGECGITLPMATLNDTGLWHCHLGTFRRTGWETSRSVPVRISGDCLFVGGYCKNQDILHWSARDLACRIPSGRFRTAGDRTGCCTAECGLHNDSGASAAAVLPLRNARRPWIQHRRTDHAGEVIMRMLLVVFNNQYRLRPHWQRTGWHLLQSESSSHRRLLLDYRADGGSTAYRPLDVCRAPRRTADGQRRRFRCACNR